MSSVNISSMYMKSDRVIVEHNQAERSKLEARIVNSFKMRVENPTASRLGVFSGKR